MGAEGAREKYSFVQGIRRAFKLLCVRESIERAEVIDKKLLLSIELSLNSRCIFRFNISTSFSYSIKLLLSVPCYFVFLITLLELGLFLANFTSLKDINDLCYFSKVYFFTNMLFFNYYYLFAHNSLLKMKCSSFYSRLVTVQLGYSLCNHFIITDSFHFKVRCLISLRFSSD